MKVYFLRVLLAIAAYLNVADANFSVIIIGAGPAGIAAASRLLENGINNITVLEAEDRIGGRICSVKFKDAYVDLGAQWCHGESENIVYQMVKDLDLLKRPEDDNINLFHSSGKQLDKEFCDSLMGMYEQIYSNEGSLYGGEEVTVADFFIPRYLAEIEEIFENNTADLQYGKEALFLIDNFICSYEGSFNLDEVSLKNTYKEEGGEQKLSWDGKGYKTILDVLMKKIPDPTKSLPVGENILLNKDVEQIIWANTSHVTVKCLDNSTYLADYVIFTPSLGVLKNRHKTLFGEDFPKKKVDVIKAMGFSSAMKVYLYFDEPFWPLDFWGSGFIWSDEDRAELIQDSKKSWLLGVSYAVPGERNPNVLLLWVGNRTVCDVEKLPDEDVIDQLYFLLNKFMGHMNVTRPSEILRSNWYTNPHFQGIYSFQTIEARRITPTPPEVLQEPLLGKNGRPMVLFAGEATNPIHYSTVHGAIETGFREADRLINLHNSV